MTMTTTSTVLDNDGDTVMTTASKATQRADYEVRCDYSGVVYIVQRSRNYLLFMLCAVSFMPSNMRCLADS